jgi:ribonucleoside-diphosphate reductase alpha chain
VSIKFDGCVHPDTVLLTDKGEITIKEIIDSPTPVNVLTYNFKTGTEEYNVAQYPRINNNNKNWVMIELENGAQLRVTEDHEVFVEGKGWVEAKNLKPGDDIKEYHQKG